MPSIIATPQPIYGRVLIQINWSDVPSVTFARVLRVLTDGTTTVVRPHTFADTSGEYIELSGGQAILYDTEAPLDVSITYITEGLSADGYLLTVVATDTYTRVVVSGWGNATSGQAWTTTGGVATDYNVAAGVGTLLMSTTGSSRFTALAVTVLDVDVLVTMSPNAVATGAALRGDVMARYTNSSNHYRAAVVFGLLGVMSLELVRRVGGTDTVLGTVALDATYGAASNVQCRFQVTGSTLRSRAWLAADPEPANWQISLVDMALTAADRIGLRAFASGGNTNVNPTIAYDDLVVSEIVQPATTSDDLILSSGDDLWLKSPIHPWQDQRLVLEVPQEPDCIPESAIFFQAMAEETRPSRTAAFVANNAKNPITAARTRGGITSTLGLISRTFVDRDNVIVLNESGDPLLFQGPADYGIPDRYMSVGDYTVSRLSPDHRKQWRVHALPHTEVGRPAGLADGVLGVRWIDLCDEFATFADAEAAGLTWTMVLLGEAALVPTPSTGFRTYDDIPIDFATYADIPLGGRTYEGLLEGD